MARPKNPVPSYRRHRQSGQAIITVYRNGKRRDILLGAYDSPESRKEFARIVAELQVTAGPLTPSGSATSTATDITIAEVLLPFLDHVERHYRHPDGTPTSEVYNYKLSLRALVELYGDTIAREFGPRSLKAVRQVMINKGWCRKQINARIGRIKRAFRWAVSEELIPVAVFQALATVSGLQAGRTDAADREPVKPVSREHVEAVLRFLNRHVRGMVELQCLTGCRPGEACAIRRADIDTGGAIWLYRPAQHKTAWRGKTRVIAIGPKAQVLLREFFTPAIDDFLFSPRAAVDEFHAARTAARTTPRYRSHMARNEERRVAAPKRTPAERYTTDSYNQAIARACEKAGVPVWTPGQIRHLFATEVRHGYGLEAVQVALGHAHANVSQIYAERDQKLAEKVANEIG